MTRFPHRGTVPAAFALLLTACSAGGEGPAPSPEGPATPAASDTAATAGHLTREGRVEAGAECPLLHTPDGEIYALASGADVAVGDYIEVTGTLADASYCQQGQGTLVPERVTSKSPPARDRDPARAGGIAVTSEYLVGSWVAKSVDADCDRPDFTVTTNANGMALIQAVVNGERTTGAVGVGQDPAIHFDAPIHAMAIETRGPDGLAVMPPDGGPAVSIAQTPIEGDGVVFVKCA